MLTAVVAFLALAPGAAAKGDLAVCGSAGRTAWSPRSWWDDGVVTEASLPPAPAGRYVTIVENGRPIAYWLPQAHLIRTVDIAGVAQWVDDTPVATDLARAAASVSPYPVPRPALARVAGRLVPDPVGYLRLFSIGREARFGPRSAGWLRVRIFTTPASPWGDGANAVFVSRRGGWLFRDRHYVRISPTIAQRIRRRLPLC